MDLHTLTIQETAEGFAEKQFSSVEVTKAYLDRTVRLNPTLNVYLNMASENALVEARAADVRRQGGESGPLLGVPLAIKDNMMTVGLPTTAASKMLERYQSTYDATVISKLRMAGAVILGKTNLDEWAHGASTENSAFGPTKNPWDVARVPGGSSGGSAAAVAADLCAGALGSDTGGSIRHPAAFFGVVGLKTSYGRVSRSGLLSMTSSTDVIGPMAKTVRDAAVLLAAIAGPDPLDQTAYPIAPKPGEYEVAAVDGRDLKGIRFGLPKEFFFEGSTTPAVAATIQRAVETLQSLGATVREVSLPSVRYSVPVYYVITPSEISSNLARYDGIRFGYQTSGAANLFDVYAKSRGQALGPEAKRRIMIGTYALSYGYYDAYYRKAQQVRTLIVREFEAAFKDVDAMLSPASPHVAFKIGAQVDDPLKMYAEDIFLSAASLAGLPSLVVPAGFAKPDDGATSLPVGLQIIGRRFDEATLLGVGHAFEQATEWHTRKPEL